MEFGIFAPPFAGGDYDVRILNRPFYKEVDWNAEKNAVLEAEKAGFRSYWVCDHLSVGDGGSVLENWSTVTTYLNITRNLRVGPLALCNSYRYPSIVAKMAATLDVISGGRLNLAMGAGWLVSEYDQYGVPFPSGKVRVDQLRESIMLIKKLWREQKVTFEGKYYHVKDAVCAPKPIQKPHPPIFIGGGTDSLIRLAAEMADGYNWFFSPENYREKLRKLEKVCSKIGRDHREIKKSWLGHICISKDRDQAEETYNRWFGTIKSAKTRLDPWTRDSTNEQFRANVVVGTPTDCIEKLKRYRDIGVDLVMCTFIDHPSTEGLRLFGSDVIPYFK